MPVKHLIILLPLLVAGCARTGSATPSDNKTDPAVAQALAEPLMSDQQMAGASSPDALQPGEQPATLPVPIDARIDTAGAPTLGTVAAEAVKMPDFANCPADLAYSAMWSLKLPARLGLPQAARLAEAAGRDRPGCAIRIVRYAMPGAPASVLDDFEAQATGANFVTGRSGDMLTGARAGDGTAFRIGATASQDGSRVDLVTRSR